MSDRPGRTPSRRRMRDFGRLVAAHPAVHNERYWPAYVALALAVVLQVRLPSAYNMGPGWLLPSIESALLVALAGGRYLYPRRQEPAKMRRLHELTIGLIAIISVDNLTSLGLLVRELLRRLDADGRTLVLSALAIWVTNVIVFALWFWELDGGGPIPRRAGPDGERDVLFPQLQLQQDDNEASARDRQLVALGHPAPTRRPKYAGWLPDFVDYVDMSYTNATAFSPTNTMPLTRWPKMLMLVHLRRRCSPSPSSRRGR